MKFITAIFLVGFLSICSEYAVSFNSADSESMIAGLPSRPIPDEEDSVEDDFQRDSAEESDRRDQSEEGDDENNSSNDNSDRFEDWYEPDPAYQ